MRMFYNLEFVLKVSNKKSKAFTLDPTVLKLTARRSAYFRWNEFFNTVFNTKKFTSPYLFFRTLKTEVQLIKTFCNENAVQLVISGKTVFGDYELAALKFKDENHKMWFLLKYGDIINSCC